MGIHLRDSPLRIGPIYEKDLAEIAGSLGTFFFAFQEVPKGFLVIRATLREARHAFHRLTQPARWEHHIEENTASLGALPKQVENT